MFLVWGRTVEASQTSTPRSPWPTFESLPMWTVNSWAFRLSVARLSSGPKGTASPSFASLDRRPILIESIASVATLRAGGLVVQRLDRFSRDPLTAALAEAELRKCGASLLCADETGGGDDPTSELIRGILLSVARFEKALIRSRIKAALAVKRSRGERLGAPRYGFRVEGKSLLPHPEEVAVAERLRALRASGMTVRAVRDQATAEGLRNRMGRPFNVATVHAIVRAPSSPAE
jgi:DNA invertase Pin-like site-specific DNA recombinase